MHGRAFHLLLLWVAVAALALLAAGTMPGWCLQAFADAASANGQMGAVEGAGGIGGGFFNNTAVAPSLMPALLPSGGDNPVVMRPETPPAHAGPDLCGPAVAAASAGYRLPAGLLNAIATVESGKLNPQNGAEKPWPWTIDANGAGSMYPTEQAAEQAAAGFEAAGITSLDIGCLQVNMAQHPDAFQTLAQAFDPAANANYAAMFLASLERKFENWPQAVAAYHSQTPALGGPYAARVYAQWQGTGAAAVALAEAGLPKRAALPEASLPEAPVPQLDFQMSTLMPPPQMLMRSDHAMTGRSLASYRATPVAIATASGPQG
jgi:hypothetical protein